LQSLHQNPSEDSLAQSETFLVRGQEEADRTEADVVLTNLTMILEVNSTWFPGGQDVLPSLMERVLLSVEVWACNLSL